MKQMKKNKKNHLLEEDLETKIKKIKKITQMKK